MWGDTKYLLHISLKLPKESGAAASNPLSTGSGTPQLSKGQSDLKKMEQEKEPFQGSFFHGLFPDVVCLVLTSPFLKAESEPQL